MSTGTATEPSERARAIAFMLDAFEAAERAGLPNRDVALAAMFQAIMHMVDQVGEDDAIKLLNTSAEGVRRGYYTRPDTIN